MPLKLRIKVDAPPPGVLVGVQVGKGSAGRAEQIQRTDGQVTTFEMDLEVKSNGFSGPSVQKDAKGQFVYLRWGQSAGDHSTPWNRRAKIYLHPLTADRVREALENDKPLTLVIKGTAKDGGPACPTVPSTLE